MSDKAAALIGNVFLVITFGRILLAVASLTHSLLLSFGAMIIALFIFAFWEKKSPTQGKSRLWRGIAFFGISLIISIILLVIQHI